MVIGELVGMEENPDQEIAKNYTPQGSITDLSYQAQAGFSPILYLVWL